MSFPESRRYEIVDIYDVGAGMGEEPLRAELVQPAPRREPPRRRVLLPLVLFLATCLSTWYTGSHLQVFRTRVDAHKLAQMERGDDVQAWALGPNLLLLGRPVEGLKYMAAVMLVLLAHEMGHFLQAVRYRIPASWPFFIPMPISPTGTMGAVIGMQGSRADRKQLFDIGLTGPLAGLLIAVPLIYYGVQRATVELNPKVGPDILYFGDMLLVKIFQAWLRPEIPANAVMVIDNLYFAGWVGLLVTGLNMLPISQLDGGHVAYALFGRYAHMLARLMLLTALGYMVWMQQFQWLLMLLLVMYIGPDHPPTRDDTVPLGPVRWVLGLLSLLIPILCLTPSPISSTPM